MGNFFTDTLSNIVGNKKTSVLGIDIGSSSIKVVQLGKKKGKAVLETYGELALGPYGGVEIGRAVKLQPDKLMEALKDVLKESNVSTLDCAISIPMKSSMVSVFRMPKMGEKQLQQMVPVEARRYIPVPMTEVSMDWFKVPDFPDEGERVDEKGQTFLEVLMVAIHNDVLSSMSSIIAGSGLSPTFFEVEMFSTVRSIIQSTYNYPIMVIDIGAGATKMYIVERGVLRDSHLISRGAQDITLNMSRSLGVTVDFAEKLKRNFGKNEKKQDAVIAEIIDLVVSPIISEANSALLNFQKKHKKNIAKVILLGGGSQLPLVAEKAKTMLSIEAVNGDPFSKVETPAFLAEILKETGLAFSNAVGLALRKLQELE